MWGNNLLSLMLSYFSVVEMFTLKKIKNKCRNLNVKNRKGSYVVTAVKIATNG